MSHRDDSAWIGDMLEVVEKLISIVENVSYEEYLGDAWLQDGVMFNLIVLGEASGQVSGKVKEEHAHIPWRNMNEVRNRVAHGYFSVEHEVVWEILTEELPALLPQIKDLYQKLD